MADKETFEELVRKESESAIVVILRTNPDNSYLIGKDAFVQGAAFAHSIDSKRMDGLEGCLKEIMRYIEFGGDSTRHIYLIANKALNQTP